MKSIINVIVIFTLSLITSIGTCFPIPKDKIASFDVVRKNKVIGNVTSTFKEIDDKLIINTIVDINVKVLFFPAYKFFQDTTETWVKNELVEILGFTDFEDEREYKIEGKDIDGKFIASGMDGSLELDEDIITLNYWNKNTLIQEEVFDTQKGIVRKINVTKLENDKILINNKEIIAEKYLFKASKNPKDKGPFPDYTLWYYNDELLKFEFLNPKDEKIITTIRNDWE